MACIEQRDLKGHLVPTPCCRQRCQPLNQALHQAARGPIQPGFEHLQGWGIHHFSGLPVPGPHHNLSEKIPPVSNLNLTSFNLKQILFVPSLSSRVKSEVESTLLFLGSLSVLEGFNMFSKCFLLPAPSACLPSRGPPAF